MNSVGESTPWRLACLGTYIPRRCGIATFGHDLITSIAAELSPGRSVRMLAVNDMPGGYDYPECVRFEMLQEDLAGYQQAADFLNHRRIDALLVQHEYGIYGGQHGEHLLTLLRNLRMPVITTMHTVLRDPNPHMLRVTRDLVQRSERVVVMAQEAVDLLNGTYDAPPGRVELIPHGIPDMAFVDPSFHKDQFGVEGRRVLLTFGLLSPGKGIEHAIRAVADVVPHHPDVAYIVLGATHPKVKEAHGEEYRHGLERLVDDLDLADHVLFVDRYVELDELCEYLGAADIYLTPYLGEQQVVSGTLAYAMGAGKAIVSTPYTFAREMLDDGRGVLVPFADPAAMGAAVNQLLGNETARQAMRKKAYLYCRDMVWSEVAKSYLRVVDETLSGATPRRKTPVWRGADVGGGWLSIPDLNLSHLRTLTDDTGILQHATYTIPNRDHGYCTDDNARALAFVIKADQLMPSHELIDLAETYLGFLMHAFNAAEGRFRTFMSYDRKWLDEVGSEDCHARALWGLGCAAVELRVEGLREAALELFQRAIKTVASFTAPRAWADSVVGAHAYLARYSGDVHTRRIRDELAQRILDAFEQNADDDWLWLEESVNYANARVPYALLLSGTAMERPEMTEMGLKSLAWLLRHQTRSEGVLSVVGNNGWWPRGGEMARFDQQPIEAHSLLEACLEAHRITGDERWAAAARRAFSWFLGRNEAGEVIYDYQTGGCRDGLHPAGANQNEGAESTLVWLLSLLAVRSLKAAPRDGASISPAGEPPSKRRLATAIDVPAVAPQTL